MLPVVVTGVTRSLFFTLDLGGPSLSGTMDSEETVRESSLLCGRSETVAFWARVALVAALGGGWSSAIAASAAFLFRVEGGVLKRGAADCPRRVRNQE
jgi:hypothetical protein